MGSGVDLDTWKTVALPFGTIYNFLPRGDEQTSIAGAPSVRRSRRAKGDQYDIQVHASGERWTTG
jgi:hypothetical protein